MGGCVISQIYMSKTSFMQPPQGMAMNALKMKIRNKQKNSVGVDVPLQASQIYLQQVS